MTYVWITETDGKKRFVDDKYISPCRKCGNSVSVCRSTTKCEDDVQADNVMCIFCKDLGCEVCQQDNGCSFCGVDKASQCHCDNDYEDVAGK